MSDEEASDESIRRRTAAAFVVEMRHLCECPTRNATQAIDALYEALRWCGGTRNAVAAAERDERTRDLEELAAELAAARADVERLTIALAKERDAHDADGRALATLTANAVRAEKAQDELHKARALVEELREQLAAPTVQSEAVKRWLGLHHNTRGALKSCMRKMGTFATAWEIAADALDALVSP